MDVECWIQRNFPRIKTRFFTSLCWNTVYRWHISALRSKWLAIVGNGVYYAVCSVCSVCSMRFSVRPRVLSLKSRVEKNVCVSSQQQDVTRNPKLATRNLFPFTFHWIDENRTTVSSWYRLTKKLYTIYCILYTHFILTPDFYLLTPAFLLLRNPNIHPHFITIVNIDLIRTPENGRIFANVLPSVKCRNLFSVPAFIKSSNRYLLCNWCMITEVDL